MECSQHKNKPIFNANRLKAVKNKFETSVLSFIKRALGLGEPTKKLVQVHITFIIKLS
jgi:hypothetical protein